MSPEDIALYLPKYLSIESKNALLDSLKEFPNSIPNTFYTSRLTETNHVYQGDGLKDFPLIELPDSRQKSGNVIVLSNTCDIAPENPRLFPSSLVYSPIIPLDKYQKFLLSKGLSEERTQGHLRSIRSQEITQILFLPADGITEESIVFFDRLMNISPTYISSDNLKNRRIFTLSNYGHYLFLFKLSFHFCRFQDRVDRDKDVAMS